MEGIMGLTFWPGLVMYCIVLVLFTGVLWLGCFALMCLRGKCVDCGRRRYEWLIVDECYTCKHCGHVREEK